MPATPAWPPRSTPRLFVEGPLTEGGQVRVEGGQAHYLLSVLRLKAGDPVKLFDDKTGEWLGVASAVGKRDLIVDVTAHLRPREPVPDLWLCAAPIKKGRIDWVAEKACELGVARLVPVLTRRTVIERLNGERLRARLNETGRKHGVPLLYVDAVASLAGAPVRVDEWSIDLLLGGAQIAFLLGAPIAGWALALMVAAAAGVALAGFCFGCYLYTQWHIRCRVWKASRS